MTGICPTVNNENRPALAMADGASISHGALDAMSARAANWLRRLGLRPGDHVAYMLENRIEAIVFAWAAHRCGLYYTPIPVHLKAGEIAYMAGDCVARLILTGAEFLELWRDVLKERSDVTLACADRGCDGAVCFWSGIGDETSAPAGPDLEGFAMLYSSGTTGRPKGIIRPLSGRAFGGDPMSVLYSHHQVGEHTVYLSPAPLYHAAPLRCVMAVQRLGGLAVVLERFEAVQLLRAIETWRATHIQLVPTMMRRLIELPLTVRSAYDLSSLRVVIHAAAPCPPDVKRAMIDWLGPIVNEYYGGTEGVGVTYITSQEWLERPGSVGRAVIGELQIIGEDGVQAPVGSPGLVYFRGGPRFSYHNDPDKTQQAYSLPGGEPADAASLGDIGRLDADGYLYLLDRASFTINSGGVNIYPREVEDVLESHPGVREAAVFGAPNRDFGEEVKAVVERAPSHAPLVGEEELIAFCRARMSHVKAPRSIEFVSALPRSEAGKVLKGDLRRRYWETQGSP